MPSPHPARTQTPPYDSAAALAAVLLPGGAPAPYRAHVARPDLARTIRRFGAEGARSFYQGDLAAKIVAAAQATGGTLEASDLAAYQVKERAPLERTIDGRTVITMPAAMLTNPSPRKTMRFSPSFSSIAGDEPARAKPQSSSTMRSVAFSRCMK